MTRTDASPLPLAALISAVLSLGVFLIAGGLSHAPELSSSLRLLPLSAAPSLADAPPAPRSQSARSALPAAPLAFEASRKGAYRARGPGYELFLDSRGSQMALRGDSDITLRTQLVGANPKAVAGSDRKLPTVVNRYSGSDPDAWQEGIATFGRVTYRGVYPGTDIRYHGADGQLEYDFVLAPAADPARIALDLSGQSSLRLAANGDLLIGAGSETVRQHRPVSYQYAGGHRVPVASKFVIEGDRVGFELGRYDATRRLVIDPSLVFGDYVGGSGADNGGRIAVDSSGNMYLAASSASASIPGSASVKRAKSTGKDAFVMKIHPDGVREWITYLGSSGTAETANDIGVDGSGRPVVVGQTNSATGFPVAGANIYQSTYGGGTRDAFATALAADGSIRWSTLLGTTAADTAGGVSVTPSGHAYVAWNVQSVDGLGNPIPPMRGYAYSFDNAGTWQYYYGQGDGSGDDTVDGVVPQPGCDSYDCDFYMTGHTKVPDPDGAAGTTIRAGYVRRYNFHDLAEIWYQDFSNPTDENQDGNLEWPGGEWPGAIAVDPAGNPVVWGTTKVAGHSWAFLVRFGKDKVGGEVIIDSPYVQFSVPPLNGDSFAGDVATDAQGNIYTIGTTLATNGSGQDAVQPHAGGAYDVAVLKYFPDGPPAAAIPGDPTGAHPNARIVWATFLGGVDNDFGVGIVTDGKGGTYVSGEAGSPFLSAKTQALAATPDAFIAKIQTNDATITEGPSGTIKPRDVTFKYSSSETGGTYQCRLLTPSASPGFSDCTGQSDYKGLTDGKYTFEINAFDSAGTSSGGITSREFTVDTSPSASFTIAPNPALAGRPVAFDASASSGSTAIGRYEWDLDGNGSFEKDGGATPTVSQVYPSAGTFTIGLRITDGEGRTGTTTAPLQVNAATGAGTQFGVTIDDGAQFTKSPDVTVTATFPSFTTSLLFSNDGGFGKAQTFVAKKETKWKLDSSGPERLPKTIYVRFLTGSISSNSFQDDIILDETPPKVDTAEIDALSEEAGTTDASAAKKKLRRYKVKMKATDKTSGVSKVQVTANKRKPGKALKYKRKFVVKSAKRPKWVRARDRAGNWSKWKKAR